LQKWGIFVATLANSILQKTPPGVAQDVLGLGEYLFKKVPLVKSLVLFLPQAFPNKFSAGVAPAPLKSLP